MKEVQTMYVIAYYANEKLYYYNMDFSTLYGAYYKAISLANHYHFQIEILDKTTGEIMGTFFADQPLYISDTMKKTIPIFG